MLGCIRYYYVLNSNVMEGSSLCKYAKVLGCSSCDTVVFRLCNKFRKARFLACGEELGKFHYSVRLKSGQQLPIPTTPVVYWSYPTHQPLTFQQLYQIKDYAKMSDILKSCAVYVALTEFSGRPVQYLSMDRCIDACFAFSDGNYTFEPMVYFIEVYHVGVSKPKVQTLLASFISKAVSAGGRVFLLTSWGDPIVDGRYTLYRFRGSDKPEVPMEADVRADQSVSSVSVADACSGDDEFMSARVAQASNLLTMPTAGYRRQNFEDEEGM